MPARVRNTKGFSLIELLIAMMLITISMLALLTMMISATNTNRSNEIRNAAIMVTNQTAEALLALPVSDPELTDGEHSRGISNPTQSQKGFPAIKQRIRGYTFSFDSIKWTASTLSKDLKQVQITVEYKDKGLSRSHSAVVYKHSAI